MADFDASRTTDLAMTVADFVAVPHPDVEVSVQPASVAVEAVISAWSQPQAEWIVERLSARMQNQTLASEFLGLTVLSPVSITATRVVPPSPPTPPTLPVGLDSYAQTTATTASLSEPFNLAAVVGAALAIAVALFLLCKYLSYRRKKKMRVAIREKTSSKYPSMLGGRNLATPQRSKMDACSPRGSPYAMDSYDVHSSDSIVAALPSELPRNNAIKRSLSFGTRVRQVLDDKKSDAWSIQLAKARLSRIRKERAVLDPDSGSEWSEPMTPAACLAAANASLSLTPDTLMAARIHRIRAASLPNLVPSNSCRCSLPDAGARGSSNLDDVTHELHLAAFGMTPQRTFRHSMYAREASSITSRGRIRRAREDRMRRQSATGVIENRQVVLKRAKSAYITPIMAQQDWVAESVRRVEDPDPQAVQYGWCRELESERTEHSSDLEDEEAKWWGLKKWGKKLLSSTATADTEVPKPSASVAANDVPAQSIQEAIAAKRSAAASKAHPVTKATTATGSDTESTHSFRSNDSRRTSSTESRAAPWSSSSSNLPQRRSDASDVAENTSTDTYLGA